MNCSSYVDLAKILTHCPNEASNFYAESLSSVPCVICDSFLISHVRSRYLLLIKVELL